MHDYMKKTEQGKLLARHGPDTDLGVEVVEAAERAFKKNSVSLVTLGPLEEKDLDGNNISFG